MLRCYVISRVFAQHNQHYGFELSGLLWVSPVNQRVGLGCKKTLNGLKIAFGPQLWWGANPAVFVKYQRKLGGIDWTGIFQEDFAQQTVLTSSVAIPTRSTRKASLQMTSKLGPFGFEGGALWAGQPREGEIFQLVDNDIVASGAPVAAEDAREKVVPARDDVLVHLPNLPIVLENERVERIDSAVRDAESLLAPRRSSHQPHWCLEYASCRKPQSVSEEHPD